VSLDDVQSAVARLADRADVRIVSLRPTRLAGVLGDIEPWQPHSAAPPKGARCAESSKSASPSLPSEPSAPRDGRASLPSSGSSRDARWKPGCRS